MTIVPFAAGSLNPMMDGILISLVLIHSHLGFEYVSIAAFGSTIQGSVQSSLTWSPKDDLALIKYAFTHVHRSACITDYFPKWRVPGWRKILNWARNLALVIVGWGWYEFETNDVGLTEGIKRIWKA